MLTMSLPISVAGGACWISSFVSFLFRSFLGFAANEINKIITDEDEIIKVKITN